MERDAEEVEIDELEGSVDALAFPLLAQGHIIPFMCLCELLASKNLNIVFLTTLLNAKRLKAKQTTVSSSRVRIIGIPLPSLANLPAGAENTDQLMPSQFFTLFAAAEQMEPSFTKLVARLRPKCLIADFCPLFLPAVADKLKIPVFFYVTMGAYGLSMMQAVVNSLPLVIPADGPPTVLIPGLPKPVSFHDSDIVHPYRGADRTGNPHDLFSKFFEHIRFSAGVIMNTFEEMEGEFVDHVRRSFGVPVWSIGPVLSSPSGDFEKGGVKDWLDRRAAGSVVYINFGSEIALSGEQIKVVSAGLEASGQWFLWAVKNPPGVEALQSDLLLQGFRERTADRGLVVTGWAPQQVLADVSGGHEGVPSSCIDKEKGVAHDDVPTQVWEPGLIDISIRGDSPIVTPSAREAPRESFLSLLTQPTIPKEGSVDVGVGIGGTVRSLPNTYVSTPDRGRRPRGQDQSEPNTSSKMIHFDDPPMT